MKFTKPIFQIFLTGFLTCAFFTGMLFAQATGQISGRVTDPTEAVLPGVEVTLTRTDTGVARTAVTNETGTYVFPNLNPGPFRLEVSLPGFQTFVQTGIVLQVGTSLVIDPVLEVGEVAQTVEVQAASEVQVETRSMAIAEIIETERVLELPLAGRQVTDLITLAGAGAVQTSTGARGSMVTAPNISVAGVPGRFGTEFTLDGALAMNRFFGTGMPAPFPDALQEFRVASSTQEANVGGRATGASVSQVTRSGTNEFHGSLFWFVRNEKFNAKEVDAPTKNQLKRNQPGGTIGGPIIRDKLFFFYGWQSTIERDNAATTLEIVPTPAMLAGDFTTFNTKCGFNPAWTDADFASGTVDPARFSPAALQVAARLPAPQNECGELRFAGSRTAKDDWQTVGRLDYQHSQNHSLFGRYMITREFQPPTADPDNILSISNAAGGLNNFAHQAAVGHTWIVNPSVVSSSRVSFSQIATRFQNLMFFSPEDVGINMFTAVPGHFSLDTDGFFDFGGNITSRRNVHQHAIQVGNDTSWATGAHQINLGGTWQLDWMTSVANTRSPGSLAFDGRHTGNAMGDFLTGQLQQVRQSGVSLLNPRQNMFYLYGQDTWRATPNFTVNLGLRWEPLLPMIWDPLEGTNGGVRLYRFDPDRFKAGQKSAVFPNAPAGFLYPVQTKDEGGPSDFEGRGAHDRIWNLLAPRIGVAWDPFGDGRTSIRAGYSYAYDVVALSNIINANNVAPWALDVLHRNGTLADPYQGLPGGNPFPFDFRTNPKFAEGAVFLPFEANGEIGAQTIQSWNLSVQRQIGETRFSLSYLGNQSTHLWTTEPANPSLILTPQSHPSLFTGPNTCVLEGRAWTPCNQSRNINQRRELRLWANANGTPQQIADSKLFSTVDFFRATATAQYHGLVASVRGRVAGINLNTNYTWGHCISDRANAGIVNPNQTPVRPEERDRANCDSDRRHIFNLTGVYSLPTFETPVLRALASNWRVSVINRIASGQYLTISTGTDRLLTGLNRNNQRVNQVLDNVKLDESGDFNSRFLNRAAFAFPAPTTIGNMGVRSVRGFKNWSLDMAISRTFNFLESHSFEIRGEAFNLTNSTRPEDPSTNFRSGLFGRVTEIRDPRIVQFALKYVF